VIVNLNGNVINGSLPKLLKYCNALEVLDMGNNRIVSRFPYWLGNLENLSVLVLKSNMLYGEISDMELKPKGSDSVFPMLKVLDLSTNHFNGTLSRNLFVNLKAMMGVSNTSSLNYHFDLNVSYTPYIASVTYKGLSFDLRYSVGIFSYIDLSNNEFWGRIPEEIGQLLSLDVVNLSQNSLTGPIPSELVNLHQLQLLDLSSNQLSGHIPQELTSLTFLSQLNLSYNNLVGEIPEARQFSTFSNASYLGNPGLCGSPLSLQCPTPPSNYGFNKGLPLKSSTDIIGISVSIGLGLGVGFAFVIWATISWENGRKWFNFIIDRFYLRHFH
jgi:Leucine-rich repeat (LRR) protein